MTAQQGLSSADFTRNDAEAFRQLMNELVGNCRAVAQQYPTEWRSAAPDLQHQFGESMVLIADLSRALNRARRGIRTINDRARYRACFPAAPLPGQQP
ncbi:hypothetical protein [Streptomyces flavalbus]|uniref:WXG100 family type VII secretion target n=1 Tax=Streptomyces flavalbus TaxID=2665155 RepID=A0ABW2WJ62_9ACTN